MKRNVIQNFKTNKKNEKKVNESTFHKVKQLMPKMEGGNAHQRKLVHMKSDVKGKFTLPHQAGTSSHTKVPYLVLYNWCELSQCAMCCIGSLLA